MEARLAISPRRPGGSRDRRVLRLQPAAGPRPAFLSAAAGGARHASRRHSLLYIEVGERRRLYKDLEALLDLGNRFYLEVLFVHRRRVLVASR